MPEKIDKFDGMYAFLSNFYLTPVVFEDLTYPSSECAFQAAKCANPDDRIPFTRMLPGAAKRAGRQVQLRRDWDAMKDEVMEEILRDKFTRTPALRDALLATGNAELIEGNYWHDNYWGACTCPTCAGKIHRNRLGELLMKLRRELQEEPA